MCSAPENATNTIEMEAEDRECHVIFSIEALGECLRTKPIFKTFCVGKGHQKLQHAKGR